MPKYEVTVTAEVPADGPGSAIDAVVKKGADITSTQVRLLPEPVYAFPPPSPPRPSDVP